MSSFEGENVNVPSSSNPIVHAPSTISEALSIYSDHPGARLFAGGTWLMNREPGARDPKLDSELITLAGVEDLKKITRSERYLEIGSMATISTILTMSASFAPDLLQKSLRSIGYLPTRNQATLGGNINIDEQRASAFPVLTVLEAQIELRSIARSRWVSISRFVNSDGTLNRNLDEICTRIRVPNGDWNIQEFRGGESGLAQTNWSISFCGIAETRKGVLSDFRFCFGSMGKILLRSREIEAALTSRKIPISSRDREEVREQLALAIESLTPGLSEVQARTAQKYLDSFLRRINAD